MNDSMYSMPHRRGGKREEMRRFGFFMSAVTAVLVGGACAADYEFSPLVGGDLPEGNLGLHSGEWVFGGAFQFNNIFQTIKPEVMVLFSPDAEYKHSSETTTIGRFMVNGVYEYDAVGSAIPFVKAGLGYENMTKDLYDNEDSVMADAGMGLKLPLTETIALKLEALYMLKYNADRWDNNLAGLAGLTFSFGGSDTQETAPVVEEVLVEEVIIVDSDGDGVSDANDRCSGTPAGAAVDANGCQPDGDGDGVADVADQCPNSAAGAAVDADGCELDGDNDGVVDSADQCPGTPAGAAVDAQGCMPDRDRDGVPDHTDRCPNTPSGTAVDTHGCLLDGDHDGVPDRLDKCPDTPKGAIIDGQGCPIDSDRDGVIDLDDTCPGTPGGFKVDAAGCPIAKTLKLNFETNSPKIAEASLESVDDFARFLAESPAYKIVIVGHTDSIGNNADNMALSKARAERVKARLVEDGINADRIRAEGKGETQPVADNGTEAGRTQNRRVEVWLLK